MIAAIIVFIIAFVFAGAFFEAIGDFLDRRPHNWIGYLMCASLILAVAYQMYLRA